jgi:tetratricopeptide (TPR) repeat protein
MIDPFAEIGWMQATKDVEEAILTSNNSRSENKQKELDNVIVAMEVLVRKEPGFIFTSLTGVSSKTRNEFQYVVDFIKKIEEGFDEKGFPHIDFVRLQILYARLQGIISGSGKTLSLLKEYESFYETNNLENQQIKSSYAMVLSFIGLILTRIKEVEQAEMYLVKAKKIFDNLNTVTLREHEEHYNTSFILISLLQEKGKLQEAKTLLLESVLILKKLEDSLGDKHFLLLERYRRVATSLASYKVDKEAFEYYDKTFKILEEMIKEYCANEEKIDSSFIAPKPMLAFDSSELFYNRDSLKRRENEWRKKMIDIEKEKLKIDPRNQYLEVISELAFVHSTRNNFDEAETIIQDAITKYSCIFEKYQAAKALEAEIYLLKGIIAYEKKNVDEAQKLMESGWEKYQKSKVFVNNPVLLQVNAFRLADLYLERNMKLEAKELLIKLLNEIEEHDEYVKKGLYQYRLFALVTLSRIFYQQDEYQKAENCCEKGRNILQVSGDLITEENENYINAMKKELDDIQEKYKKKDI